MLLSAELPLVLGAIELLLGGRARDARQGPPPDRHRLGARPPLLRPHARRSSRVIWTDVAGVELAARRRSTGTIETAQIAPVSASRRSSLTIEARIARTSSTLALLVPCSAIAPVVGRVLAARRTPARRGDDGTAARRSRRAVGARRDRRCAPRSPTASMPIEEVLALQPGDVLRLDGHAEPRRHALRRQGARPRGPPRAQRHAGAPSRSPAPWRRRDERRRRPDPARRVDRRGRPRRARDVRRRRRLSPATSRSSRRTPTRSRRARPRPSPPRLLRRRRHRRQRLRDDARRARARSPPR